MTVRALATARLRLRAFGPGDGDLLFRLYGDPGVMAIRKIGTQDRAGSDRQLAEILDHWARRGFGLFAVFDAAGGGFLGECGLRESAPDDPRIELSYGLLPAAWGRGLATEASAAMLDYGFRTLGLPEIHARARADNAASRRVMAKLGMRHEETLAGARHDVVRYALARPKETVRA